MCQQRVGPKAARREKKRRKGEKKKGGGRRASPLMAASGLAPDHGVITHRDEYHPGRNARGREKKKGGGDRATSTLCFPIRVRRASDRGKGSAPFGIRATQCTREGKEKKRGKEEIPTTIALAERAATRPYQMRRSCAQRRIERGKKRKEGHPVFVHDAERGSLVSSFYLIRAAAGLISILVAW